MRASLTIVSILALALPACGGGDGDEGGDPADVATSSDSAEPTIDEGPAVDGAAETKDEGEPVVEGPFPGAPAPEELEIPGLEGPVHIVRDETGMPHVHATTLHDLFFAQGYVHALDRFPQMEVFRRAGTGRVANLLGALSESTLLGDIVTKTLGFTRAAEAIYEGLEEGSEVKLYLDAYSEGVNAFIDEVRSKSRALPPPFHLFLPIETLTPWTPVESLAIGRVQAHTLGFDGENEIRFTRQVQQLRERFPTGDADPELALRAGIVGDVWGFKPSDPTIQYPDYTPPASAGGAHRGRTLWLDGIDLLEPLRVRRPTVAGGLIDRGLAFFEAQHRILGPRPGRGASNHWVVEGSRTKSGHAMICNDPHLGLGSPPLFHLSHLRLDDSSPDAPLEIWGSTFPGLPGYLIAHTRTVAWGLTTSSDDRSDVYEVDYVAGSGDSGPMVQEGGEMVPVTVLRDRVEIGSLGLVQDTVTFDIQLTPSGRVLVPEVTMDGVAPMATGKQLAYAWGGFDASPELETLVQAARAEGADDVLRAFTHFFVPNQHVVGADIEGNIFGRMPGNIPIRGPGARTWDPDTNPDGTAPWWILPGDGSADWIGELSPDDVPSALNPDEGFIVAANNQHVGTMTDGNPLNDPIYFGYDYARGYRAGRILRLVDGTAAGSPAAGGAKLGFEEMTRIQADTYSNLGHRLRDILVAALDRFIAANDGGGDAALEAALAQYTGLGAHLAAVRDLLAGWNLEVPSGLREDEDLLGDAPEPDAETLEHSSAATLFNIWIVELVDAAFTDELEHLDEGLESKMLAHGLLTILENEPDAVRTLEPQTGESILWDDLDTPDVYETRDAILIDTLAAALSSSAELFGGTTELDERPWGKLHRLRFPAILPLPGGHFDVPGPDSALSPLGFARPGDNFAVNVCSPGVTDHDYSCGWGPVIRFCVELDPELPRAYNMLPGGMVMDVRSPHYLSWLPGWLRHEPIYWPRTTEEIVERAADQLALMPAE